MANKSKKKYNKNEVYLLPINEFSLGGSLKFNEVTGTNYNSLAQNNTTTDPNAVNKGIDPNMLNYLGQTGTMVSNGINQMTTDPRGIQSNQVAGFAGALEGGAKGFQLGTQLTGNPLIGAGVGLGLAALEGFRATKANKKENEAAAKSLTDYYGALPKMISANPYKMENGGQMNQERNYEFGGFNDYNGNSHSEGGIPLGNNAEVEGGEVNYKDYIFSDKLTPDKKKSSFASQAKRIKSKYKGREYDSAAERAMEQELTGLMQQNELARKIEEAKQAHLQQIEGIKQQFANGGNKPKGFNPYNEEDSSYIDFLVNQSQIQEPRVYNVNREDLLDPSMLTAANTTTPITGENAKAKRNFKVGREEAALALSMLPATYNTIKGYKPDVTSFHKVLPEMVSLENERTGIRNEGAIARQIANANVRSVGGGSGAVLSNLATQNSSITNNLMRALGQSYQNEATTNVGIRNQFNAMNNNIINEEIIANEQNKAMSDSLKSLALSDLSNNAQGYLRDKGLAKENIRSNQEKMNLINQLFPNYTMNKDPKTDQLMIQYINSIYTGK